MYDTKLLIQILPCSDNDFLLVKKFINEFALDNTNLKREQFLLAKFNNELVGFVRQKNYSGCSELCSLGVIESYRLKGVGSKLVKAIIHQCKNPLYLVAIIPKFFTPFGFNEIADYPNEILNKLQYCQNSLGVPEPYVVMKLNKSIVH